MSLRLRSLQAQLAARLAIAILTTTALAIGVILYQGSQAADALGNAQLFGRARELARLVKSDPGGMQRLDLPPKLEQRFRSPTGTDLFLVQGTMGEVIGSSSPEFAGTTADLSIPGDAPLYFRLEQFGPSEDDYYGLRVRLGGAVGGLLVTVARASDAHALAYALLRAIAS
jgi:hypothetical protein